MKYNEIVIQNDNQIVLNDNEVLPDSLQVNYGTEIELDLDTDNESSKADEIQVPIPLPHGINLDGVDENDGNLADDDDDIAIEINENLTNQSAQTKQHPLVDYQNQLINNTIGGTTLLDINDINLQDLNQRNQTPPLDNYGGLLLPKINNDNDVDEMIIDDQNQYQTSIQNRKRTYEVMQQDDNNPNQMHNSSDDNDEPEAKKQRLFELLQHIITRQWSIK